MQERVTMRLSQCGGNNKWTGQVAVEAIGQFRNCTLLCDSARDAFREAMKVAYAFGYDADEIDWTDDDPGFGSICPHCRQAVKTVPVNTAKQIKEMGLP